MGEALRSVAYPAISVMTVAIAVAMAAVPATALMAMPVVDGAALPLRSHIRQVAKLRQRGFFV